MKDGKIDDLREIIAWLLGVEALAAKVYTRAAEKFSQDTGFSAFLKGLAEDERGHYDIIERAGRLLSEKDVPPSAVSVSGKTCKGVEGYFLKCDGLIDMDGLTREELLDCIISAEYSEWNDLFLYVVNAMKHAHGEFRSELPCIQRHKTGIERYLRSDPGFAVFLKRIAGIPRIWEEMILVVDDSSSITDVLSSILESEGSIVTATNGREALEKLGDGYFAAIVSDQNMPVMDGVEFYREASARYPDIKERFIFFTSEDDPGFLEFVKAKGLKLLKKPASIGDVRKEVVSILSK